jgi:hypothetical protein
MIRNEAPREFLHFFRSQQGYGSSIVEFLRHVAKQSLMAGDNDLRHSMDRLDSQEVELQRENFGVGRVSSM